MGLNRLQKVLLILIGILLLPFLYGFVVYNRYDKVSFLSVKRLCVPDMLKPFVTEDQVKKYEGEKNLQEKLFGRKCNYNPE